MIAEYIYLDRRRINSYFEQYSPPLKLFKIPNWKVAFGLAGPSVEGSQTQSTRPFTDHEKLLSLVGALTPKKGEDPDRCNFGLGTFTARRAFLPPSMSKRTGFQGLSLWICQSSEDSGLAYLIEDFPRDDDDRQNWSGNTALSMLLSEISEEIENTTMTIAPHSTVEDEWEFSLEGDFHSRLQPSNVLTTIFQSGNVPIEESVSVMTCGLRGNGGSYKTGAAGRRFSVYIQADDRHPERSQVHIRRDRFQELCAKFATNPYDLLTEWKAEIGPKRHIDALYRIRHTMIEASTIDSRGALIGYPIVIAESPSPLIVT